MSLQNGLDHRDRNTCILNDASEMIGQTPLVYINKISKDLPAKIGGKFEYFI
jgi:hypothetical protein